MAAAIAGAGGYLMGQGKTPRALLTQYMTWPAVAASGDAAGTREKPADSSAAPAGAPSAGSGGKRILYYRNPMGLPDTSPAPKKDWMGMDYIAVYEGEEQEDGSTVKVSTDRIQRSGVRTEKVARRPLTAPVRVPGIVQMDERRITTVALRFDGYIEELYVNATEQHVRAGQPLFRLYSQSLQLAQVDLAYAGRENKIRPTPAEGDRVIESAMIRMRNMGVPESRVREVQEKGANPRTIDWPAPASGIVIEKKVLQGQRVQAGDELYRILDLSNVWLIAEVPERDLPNVRIGDTASVTFVALPGQVRKGKVTFIYNQLNSETRTARVRIELPNPDNFVKIGMYADVAIGAGGGAPIIAVPDGAVIDSGTRQIVLVAKGEGRFEPRPVKLGRRGEGMVEILEGVTENEEVVAAATFLIDAESNLKAALQGFAQPEAPK